MIFWFFLLFFTGTVSQGEESSRQLMMKDYEEMRELLERYQKPQEGEDKETRLTQLKKGLKILFSRPDKDNLKSSLVRSFETEINSHSSFIKILREIVQEAIRDLQGEKGSISYQVNLLYILENTLSHIERLDDKKALGILKDISKAQIKISKEMLSYLLLNNNRGEMASPSYLAEQMLKKRMEKKKAVEKKRKALAKKKKKQKKKKLTKKKEHKEKP